MIEILKTMRCESPTRAHLRLDCPHPSLRLDCPHHLSVSTVPHSSPPTPITRLDPLQSSLFSLPRIFQNTATARLGHWVR